MSTGVSNPERGVVAPRARLGGVLVLVCTAAFAMTPPAARAQEPAAAPGDSLMAAPFQRVAGMFGQMGPMYETMMRSMVEGTLKALSDSANIDRLAAFSRRYHQGLLRQGFTREEALQIVAGFGLPVRLGR